MDFYSEYRSKLRTPEQAVQCVKSGDWIDYTSQLGFPILLDRALSRRRQSGDQEKQSDKQESRRRGFFLRFFLFCGLILHICISLNEYNEIACAGRKKTGVRQQIVTT